MELNWLYKLIVFWKRFLFFRKFVSKLNYWKRSIFPVIVTSKLVNLSNGGLFWKLQVLFFGRAYNALSVEFKMKPLKSRRFPVVGKNQLKFCRKRRWKEQSLIFYLWDVYHLTQTSLFFNILQLNVWNLIDCINIWKRSEAAKLLFQ